MTVSARRQSFFFSFLFIFFAQFSSAGLTLFICFIIFISVFFCFGTALCPFGVGAWLLRLSYWTRNSKTRYLSRSESLSLQVSWVKRMGFRAKGRGCWILLDVGCEMCSDSLILSTALVSTTRIVTDRLGSNSVI